MNQVVIAVGGRGERAKPLSDLIPKPLFVFSGETFLSHLISQFIKRGATRFLLLTGYLHEQFLSEVSILENNFSISIQVHYSPPEFETGARLVNAKSLLSEEFVFLYGDVYLPLSELEIDYLLNSNSLSFYSYQGDFRKDNQNVLISNELLIEYQKNPFEKANAINCGYFLLRADLLEQIDPNLSIENTLFFNSKIRQSLIAKVSHNKYYTTGDPSRRAMAEIFFSKKKTILFDRDGTLLKGLEPGAYYSEFSKSSWKEGAIGLLKQLSDCKYQLGIITNQPSVGNGLQSNESMIEVNRKLLEDLSANGIYMSVYCICAHGWDDRCKCRKPRPGLMFEAQHLLDLNWSSTIYIGDMERDERLATNVGCRFIKVDSTESQISHSLFDKIQDYFMVESTQYSIDQLGDK